MAEEPQHDKGATNGQFRSPVSRRSQPRPPTCRPNLAGTRPSGAIMNTSAMAPSACWPGLDSRRRKHSCSRMKAQAAAGARAPLTEPRPRQGNQLAAKGLRQARPIRWSERYASRVSCALHHLDSRPVLVLYANRAFSLREQRFSPETGPCESAHFFSAYERMRPKRSNSWRVA